MSKPHDVTPTSTAGVDVEDAEAAVLCLHGRGSTAAAILDLAERLRQDEVAYVAPQAEDREWYPQSFLAPREENEPYLSAALDRVDVEVENLLDRGVDVGSLVLLGFSQGACLASEYGASHARSYGGVVAFSGGLIGEEIEGERYRGSLEGAPAFFGCSDRDRHIPWQRVEESADVYRELDAEVEVRKYEDMGHTVVDDEIRRASDVVESARR